jgi:V8-like Glu-specific endopeptidase
MDDPAALAIWLRPPEHAQEKRRAGPARRLTDAVAVLVRRSTDQQIVSVAEAVGLCRDERYADEPALGSGTGFLVARDRVLTAGHCVGDVGSRVRVGFGWTDGSVAPVLHEATVVERGADVDWALLALASPLDGVAPLRMRTTDVSVGARLGMLGHPLGMPMRFAQDGEVVEARDPVRIRTTLDAYAGNSGSPVFDDRGLVCGMLVAGNPDLKSNGRCFRIQTFRIGAADEAVVRVSQLPHVKDPHRVGPSPPADEVRTAQVPWQVQLAAYLESAYPTWGNYFRLRFLWPFQEMSLDRRTARTLAQGIVEELEQNDWQRADRFWQALREDRPARRDEIDQIETAVGRLE